MSFLLQIYCPLDEPSDAFHRAIYIFCCASDACVATEPDKAILALRCQLPRQNPFYASEPDIPLRTEISEDSLARDWGTKLCALCGCRAASACARCKVMQREIGHCSSHQSYSFFHFAQVTWYCGREHQQLHWQEGGHRQTCGKGENIIPSLNPKWLESTVTPNDTATNVKLQAAPQKRMLPLSLLFPAYSLHMS